MAKLEERVSKHDRQIAAMQKLILTGMKMLVKNNQGHEQHFLRMEGAQFELRQQQIAFREELHLLAEQDAAFREELRQSADQERATRRELRQEIRLLAAQQRETSKTLDRFIRSLERGRNGRNGHSKN